MGTSFETIETKAMMYIKNDISLDQDLSTRLPLFYNRMKAYLMTGKSYFNKPPKMTAVLSAYTEPNFEEYIYTPEEDQTAPASVSTGILGQNLCSVGIVEEDVYGVPQYTALELTSYDAETGIVVINADLKEGDNVVIDFYTSGEFSTELTDEQIDILAYCTYVAWENRFINNVLERVAKIRDTGFTPISEASHMDANTARIKHANDTMQDWLRRYEQNTSYLNVIGN